MDRRKAWTDFDEAGDYVVPNVISPRDQIFRPDNMDKTVPRTTARFVSDLVGNPEDRISHDAAQICSPIITKYFPDLCDWLLLPKS